MRKFLTKKVVNTFTHSKTSRATAEVSADSSASIADVSQSNHSAATSRNLRELSTRLDDYLEQLDSTGSELEMDVISLSRQIEKVECYANGSLPESLEPVSVESTDLIKLAASASKAVYGNAAAELSISDYTPTEHEEKISASIRDGTVKATQVQLFSSPTGQKVLVVAIRGSTSKRRDWTINFDDIGEGSDGDGFIDSDEQKYQVHGGFLECAKGMIDKVTSAISSVLGEQSGVQLLFTGHSAGGAVASLLYAHMVSPNQSTLTELLPAFTSIHCIVFGSPPVTTPALEAPHSDSIFYSIINEGDPVPRIDKDFASSLLHIYVSPMPPKPVIWELPIMQLNNAGTILFLKNGVDGFSGIPDDKESQKTREVLEATIFGNPRAHKMDMYLYKLSSI